MPSSKTVNLTAEHLAAIACPICDADAVELGEPSSVTGEREDRRIGWAIPVRCRDEGHEFTLMISPFRGRMFVTLAWPEGSDAE